MLKPILICILFIGLLSSCGENDDTKPVGHVGLDCSTVDCLWLNDYAGSALVNGLCWQAEWARIDTFDTTKSFSIFISGGLTNEIWEFLHIYINDSTNLRDTIWLGGFYSNHPMANIARITYNYYDDLVPAGSFDFTPTDGITYRDYLIIDYFNADTTIIEGHFQVRFPENSVNTFITHEPDTMNIQCGYFHAKP